MHSCFFIFSVLAPIVCFENHFENPAKIVGIMGRDTKTMGGGWVCSKVLARRASGHLLDT